MKAKLNIVARCGWTSRIDYSLRAEPEQANGQAHYAERDGDLWAGAQHADRGDLCPAIPHK
jgi:hypothetical protein